jgi:hypothetical protein
MGAWVSPAQEVAVQRVRGTAFDGLDRGDERLPEHLSAEDALAADVAAQAPEQVLPRAASRRSSARRSESTVSLAAVIATRAPFGSASEQAPLYQRPDAGSKPP